MGAIDHGAVLLDLLKNRPLEGFERSFKLSERSLLSNRYLLGMPISVMPPDTLVAICKAIGMPAHCVDSLLESLPRAAVLHFGFEQGENSAIYKVYLEFAEALGASRGVSDPRLLHLAYKWNALDPQTAIVARYQFYPGLSVNDINARCIALYPGQVSGAACAATEQIVALASRRSDAQLMYLEVSEEGNPRRSFDVKLHEAELQLQDIEPQLEGLTRHYAISQTQFAPLFQSIKRSRLAHISGGISRHGKDFVTVYYETEAP